MFCLRRQSPCRFLKPSLLILYAVSPEKAADKILAGGVKNRFLVYTSADIRALYAFKRVAWWPYSVAMRQVNLVFTRMLRPAPVVPR